MTTDEIVKRLREIVAGFNGLRPSIVVYSEAAADRLAELQAENKRLKEALELLVAAQNGPPLVRDQFEWEAAMEAALAALREET